MGEGPFKTDSCHVNTSISAAVNSINRHAKRKIDFKKNTSIAMFPSKWQHIECEDPKIPKKLTCAFSHLPQNKCALYGECAHSGIGTCALANSLRVKYMSQRKFGMETWLLMQFQCCLRCFVYHQISFYSLHRHRPCKELSINATHSACLFILPGS